ncbi:MAG TPA: hypothetical protein EYN66_07960 [Myxococcales bacterium]|nr:hypothetical protein [Myxococcales bacterium]
MRESNGVRPWCALAMVILAFACGSENTKSTTTEPDSTSPDIDTNDILEPDSSVADSELQKPECAAPKDCIAAGFEPGYCNVPACMDGKCVAEESNEVCNQGGYFDGLTHGLPHTVHNRPVALIGENYFESSLDKPGANLAASIDRLKQLENEQGDGLVLPLRLLGNTWVVASSGDLPVQGATAAALFGSDKLGAMSQLLFLDLVDGSVSAENIYALLDLLSGTMLARPGRPVFVRAKRQQRQSLLMIRNALTQPAYAALAPNVRIHECFLAEDLVNVASAQNLISQSYKDGLHGVEVHHQSSNIMGSIGWAQSLDLGVGVWGVPENEGAVFIAAWRNEVDFIVTHYPMRRAREVVENENAVFYLNLRGQDIKDGGIKFYKNDAEAHTLGIDGGQKPKITLFGPGEDLVGPTLDFANEEEDRIGLGHAYTHKGAGFLVTAVVNFDELLAVVDGQTRQILGNSDSAGFYLDLYNPVGSTGVQLRFGVYVAGSYRTAIHPADSFSGNNSYFIVAAYDGAGDVQLWVDMKNALTAPELAAGGVTQSKAPVLVGADPEGPNGARFFFDGKVQQVSIQRWTPHDCTGAADCLGLDSGCSAGLCNLSTGLCRSDLKPGACEIDGACYSSGEVDPTNSCQICDPEQNTSWSLNSERVDQCIQVKSLLFQVETAVLTNAGTDNGMELCMAPDYCFALDNPSLNDLEKGEVNHFLFDLKQEPGSVDTGYVPFSEVTLRPTASTSGVDAWKPECVAIIADSKLLYCHDALSPVQIGKDSDDVPFWTNKPPLGNGCKSCYPTVLTHGPMVGHTTHQSAKIWLRSMAESEVSVAYNQLGTAAVKTTLPITTTLDDDFTAIIELADLEAGSEYEYSVLVDGEAVLGQKSSFRTAPSAGAQFTAAFGSCMKYAYSHTMPIFNKMLDAAPDLLLLIGDNMYANSTLPPVLQHYYLRMRTIESFGALLANTPTWATWDDHDYTGNNKDVNSPGKENALVAFKRYWANPYYGTDGLPGVWFSFVWGQVEFFMVDDRYYRNAVAGTMLGQEQLDWLLISLQASTAVFKVLVSGSQWTLGGSTDSWASFPVEQALILDHVMAHAISGVFLLSGDIHRTETRRLRDASATSYDVWEFTSSPLANTSSGCPGSNEPDTVVYCADSTRYFSLLKFDT